MERMKERLEALKNWDLTHPINRVSAECKLTVEQAKTIEREYRRFIALCVMYPQYSLGMRGLVDELWHAHILFTADYAAFCEAVAGHFIHHQPVIEQEGVEKDNNFSDNTAPLYEAVFGGEMDRDAWQLGNGNKANAECTQDKCGTRCDHCGRCSQTWCSKKVETADLEMVGVELHSTGIDDVIATF